MIIKIQDQIVKLQVWHAGFRLFTIWRKHGKARIRGSMRFLYPYTVKTFFADGTVRTMTVLRSGKLG